MSENDFVNKFNRLFDDNNFKNIKKVNINQFIKEINFL